jgi:hypothetical protein
VNCEEIVMRTLSLTAKFCLMFAAVLFIQGCGKRRSAPPVGTAPSADDRVASDNAAQLSDVMATWEAGDQDGAVEQLLRVDWKAADLATGHPVLGMSEPQFMALPPSEQNRVSDEALKLITTLKALSAHAISLGEKSAAAGDAVQANDYFEAAYNLGNTLADSERLLVLQLVGKSLVTKANEKLATPDLRN